MTVPPGTPCPRSDCGTTAGSTNEFLCGHPACGLELAHRGLWRENTTMFGGAIEVEHEQPPAPGKGAQEKEDTGDRFAKVMTQIVKVTIVACLGGFICLATICTAIAVWARVFWPWVTEGFGR